MGRGDNDTQVAVARKAKIQGASLISSSNRIPTWYSLKGKRYFTITETPLYTRGNQKYLARTSAPAAGSYMGAKLHHGFGDTPEEALFAALSGSSSPSVLKKIGAESMQQLQQTLSAYTPPKTGIPRVSQYAVLPEVKGRLYLRSAAQGEDVTVEVDEDYGESYSHYVEKNELLSLGKTAFDAYDPLTATSLRSDPVNCYDDVDKLIEQEKAYVVAFKAAPPHSYSGQMRPLAVWANFADAMSMAQDAVQMDGNVGFNERSENGYSVYKLQLNEKLEQQRTRVPAELSQEGGKVLNAKATAEDSEPSQQPQISFTHPKAIRSVMPGPPLD